MELGKKIQSLRKELGITQQELAEKLFVSYQAISQWENGNTNPDISILPDLSLALGVSLDELFGLPKKEELEKVDIKNVDKNAIYILVTKGNDIVKKIDVDEKVKIDQPIKIEYIGSVKDVRCNYSLAVHGNVEGDAVAGDAIACHNVGKNVTAGDSVACQDVSGNVTAGDSIACNNIIGNVTAGDSISANNIEGHVKAGEEIKCNNIDGDVECDGTIHCHDISGNAKAEEIVMSKQK